jgi:hypothetical protein
MLAIDWRALHCTLTCSWDATTKKFDTSSVGMGPVSFDFPGATPVISSNNGQDAIMWEVCVCLSLSESPESAQGWRQASEPIGSKV